MADRQQGRGGMGSHKHGVSGHPTKSPRLRHWLKRWAEQSNDRKRRKTRTYGSVRELMAKESR